MSTLRISDIEDDRVSLYTNYSEPQLYHINEPEDGVFIAETPMVIERALTFGAKPLSFFIESGVAKSAKIREIIEERGQGVPVYEADLPVINRITGFNLTRGMLAAFLRPPLPEIEVVLASRNIAVLEDVVNPTNVGAIFRSAAALGVDGILLTSACTDPFYRRAARVSMGAVFMIPWTYLGKDDDTVELLHDHHFTVISMALSADARPLGDDVLKQGGKRAVIFGAEGDGISSKTLDKSDHIAVIPMKNGVDSLNVAAASAVAFWELFKN